MISLVDFIQQKVEDKIRKKMKYLYESQGRIFFQDLEEGNIYYYFDREIKEVN